MSADLQALFTVVWETVEAGDAPEELNGRELNAAVALEMMRMPGYDPETDLRVRYLRLVNQDRMAGRFTAKDGLHAGMGALAGRMGFAEAMAAAEAAGW